MRYVLRADASLLIGAGHVMRSSALAEELILRGEEVIFIGVISELPWVEERIRSIGFTGIYDNPKSFKSNRTSDVLIIDSYEIPVEDSFISEANWLHVISLVDELTPNYPSTLRIHPGLDSNWTGNSKSPILAGPRFIPLRSSLSSRTSDIKRVDRKLKIVVVAGGTDPYNLVQKIAEVLNLISAPFDVYLFSNSLSMEVLDSRFKYFKAGSSLDEVSRDADLALTTSSTSSLEFLARGICVGIACAVENQKQYYDSLSQLEVAAKIGVRSQTLGWQLDTEKIRELVTNSDFRENLTKNASGLIDFHGASRIVDAITAL